MRRTAFNSLVIGLFIMASASLAQARGAKRGGTGLGLSIGQPTGINFKTFLGSSMAFDATVGLGLLNGSHLTVNAGLLWHKSLGNLGSAPVDWYVGLGGKLGYHDHHKGKHKHDDHDDDLHLGARAPLGVSVMLSGVPIDISLEVAPVLWIVDHVDLELDGALGVRYWF